MKKSKTMTKEQRRTAALEYAVKLAAKIGAANVSIAMLAAKQNVSAPMMFHVFESRAALTKAIEAACKKAGIKSAALPTKQAAKKAAPVKKVAALLKKPAAKKAAPLKLARPARTPAQKAARAARDAAAAPKSPAEKFKALPTPFEASVRAVQS